MGVPGFFAWLLKKYKKNNIITSSIKESINWLYLDSNCLFHPQCHKLLAYYTDSGKKIDLDKLEDKMIKRILNYINFLIAFVNPKKGVFISVDGVAPCAKISQQRSRRFKSIYDNKLKDTIKQKYNKNVSNIWNNTTITPGTKFMEKLHLAIIQHIKDIKPNITYIYSSYHTKGEGEHKILQHIKINNDDNLAIYGLDADLLFLALASGKDKLYLLREETFLNNTHDTHTPKVEIIDIVQDVSEKLNFVSIDETKACINEQFKSMIYDRIGDEHQFNNIDFTRDFIVLCYFLGNDFIPNIPSIEIKNDGLDFLLNIYIETYLTLECNGIIDEHCEINNIFLNMYIDNLANYEDYYFKVKQPKYLERIYKRSCLSDDPYDQAVWNIENIPMTNTEDPIRLGYDTPEIYKFRFYEYYYGISLNQEEHINKMCQEYLTGIKWTILYYFDKCPAWNWYYNYKHVPFVSDLVSFLKKSNFDINKIKFKDEFEITPFNQLMMVLPPQCYDLLPLEYGKLMISPTSPIIDLYPVEIMLDFLYKDSYHKCIPLIPNIEIKRILDAVNNIKISKDEFQRNIIIENLIYTKK